MSDPTPRPSLRALSLYFLRLGALGFGGPIALAGAMERELVEERGWYTREEYLEGLALAQLAPGPLAAQLAMYLGWVHGRARGAALVGLCFVLPSFVMVLGLAAAYVELGGLGWIGGAFYGISAAVIAIIARSAFKLVKLTLKKDPLLWVLFAVSFGVTAWTESEVVWLFVASGLVAMLATLAKKDHPPPIAALLAPLLPALSIGAPAAPALASTDTLLKILLYFAEAGAFVFGSGLAIVPFLYGGVVSQFHWLDDRQFLDAVAVAMITPGPVVITVAFIGYLVARAPGAVLAALGTFLPCYLFTVLPAPYFRKFARNVWIKAFVGGVSSAATGAIAGAALVLGRRALIDLPTAAIAVVTLILLLATKAKEPLLILGAGVVGVLCAPSA